MVRPALDADAQTTTVDVITTSVDCALEQNIAAALDGWWSQGGSSIGRATIESIVDFRLSARWERTVADTGGELRVRLWNSTAACAI